MDTCEVYDIHTVHRGKFSAVVALEDLLGEVDHFLYGDVKAVADSFEEDVGNMKVNDKNIPVQGGFGLQIFIL